MDQMEKTALRAGDLFEYPGPAVSGDGSVRTWYVAVLRVGKNGEYYLSLPWKGARPISRPDTLNNPYHVTAVGDLIDRHGAIPEWFSRAERQSLAAQALVREYEKVPRIDTAPLGVELEAVDCFMRGPKYPIILGVVRNGESGSRLDRLLFVLRLLGSDGFTAEQIAGLSVYQELERTFDAPVPSSSLNQD